MATTTDTAIVAGGIVSPVAERESRVPILRNVGFGVLDYLVQPLLMLLTARYFVRHLGIAKFGIWMLVLAVIGSTGTLCTGFGDAALKYVSAMRGRADYDSLRNVVQASLTLNGTFGLTTAIVFLVAAPWASRHIFRLDPASAAIFTAAIRIGSCVLLIRSISFVFVSTLRAFESYRSATQITSTTRVAIVAGALALVMAGRGVVQIMVVTLICEALAFCALYIAARRIVGPVGFNPSLGIKTIRPLASFGAFSWFQALSGTLFSQADRLVVASLLGPAALGYYGLCIQCAQPIHGLAASGSNVLFPHLSARLERAAPGKIGTILSKAFRLNFLCVLALSLPLMFLSGPLLSRWMGVDFSRHATVSLSLVALSFALLAFNIPGHYALMAFGRVRFLAGLNLFGGIVSLLVAIALIPHFGIVGAAIGRVAYGPITWLLYPKLRSVLHETTIVGEAVGS